MSLPPSHIVVSSAPAIFSQVQTFPQATIVQSNQTMVQVPVSGVNNTQVVSVPLAQVQPSSRPVVATTSNPTPTSTTTVAPISKTDENKKEDPKPTSQPAAPQVQRGTDNVVSVSKLEDLVKEVDTMQQIDDEVENVLFTLADDFIDNVVNASCLVAKNRKSSVLETKDVAIVLERQHGLYIPGFGGEDLHTYKKTTTAEAHKQRVALVRKTLKKF